MEIVFVVENIVVGISFLVSSHIASCVAAVHLIARPSLGFLLCVPFGGEVYAVAVVGLVDQQDALSPLQLRHLQA